MDSYRSSKFRGNLVDGFRENGFGGLTDAQATTVALLCGRAKTIFRRLTKNVIVCILHGSFLSVPYYNEVV